MSNQNLYSPLGSADSIRILEITRAQGGRHLFSARLVISQLSQYPTYTALSYVWGEPSPGDPILVIGEKPLQIRASLWQALNELTACGNVMKLWIDQICIDQGNRREQEQQVQLMSEIYKRSDLVTCWLGCHENDSHLAFHLFGMLGHLSCEDDQQSKLKWQHHATALIESGHFQTVDDLFSPDRRPVQAAASLVQRPWFRRLWVVQEVALASALEFRCGSCSISGDIFFNAMLKLSSVVMDPPTPWLLKPYRNALKLRQLRAQVSAGESHSFPHLAQNLSGWNCKRSHDRLIALYGLVFREKQAWFIPSYSLSCPQFYAEFAEKHMRLTNSLEILHFAGCGDTAALKLYEANGQIILQVNPPADDLPSWVPDWRVQSRPLTLIPNLDNLSTAFSATESHPHFVLKGRMLQVRARRVDKIKFCGWPYCDRLGGHIEITEHELFNLWFNVAQKYVKNADVESMFASTLVMDGRVEVIERPGIGTNSTDVPYLFQNWAAKNLEQYSEDSEREWKDGVDESARYGYIAEEICRDRNFFITEAGRLGLGSVHVSPGSYIYVIHGLKAPFVVGQGQGPDTHILRGECYVHGLMYEKIHYSDQDCFLSLS